jgi:hypothetical protein
MKVVTRDDQAKIRAQAENGNGKESLKQGLDSLYNGIEIPREISVKNWLYEEDVHKTKVLANHIDSTRYFTGPQVSILRDDNRRTTWAAFAENDVLFLCKIKNEKVEKQAVAKGKIWRYHLALNKFNGKVSIVYVTRENGKSALWLDGKQVETAATDIDFPFFSFSQVPVGHVAREEPQFAVLSYKCKQKGIIYVRHVADGRVNAEKKLDAGSTVGGLSFGIYKDKVIGRIDLEENGSYFPALVESTDKGETFSKPQEIDISDYLQHRGKEGNDMAEQSSDDYRLQLNYAEPIVDKGGSFNAPVLIGNGKRTIALNYNVDNGLLVEAISIPDQSRPRIRLGRGGVEVFPSTVGSKKSFGNGISDGHGLIMVLADEKGHLYTSNSSAGGSYFPERRLLNHEMPLVAAFASSECYSNGQLPNIVSMDYVYIEANEEGDPFSARLHFETWHMPLPLPVAKAYAKDSSVEIKILADADLEPGKVIFGFDDPKITIKDISVKDLRTAVVNTDSKSIKGKTLTYDVLTLFHRHYGEVVVE